MLIDAFCVQALSQQSSIRTKNGINIGQATSNANPDWEPNS